MEHESQSTSKEPMFKDAQDMADATGLTVEEAQGILDSWGYKAPTDIHDLQIHNWKSKRYETGMELLNSKKNEGLLSQDEYDEQEHALYVSIYGDEQQ